MFFSQKKTFNCWIVEALSQLRALVARPTWRLAILRCHRWSADAIDVWETCQVYTPFMERVRPASEKTFSIIKWRLKEKTQKYWMMDDGFCCWITFDIFCWNGNMCNVSRCLLTTHCLKVRAAEVALADSYESVRTSWLFVHQIGVKGHRIIAINQPNLQMNFVKILSFQSLWTRWVRLWTTSSKSMTSWKAHVSRLPRCRLGLIFFRHVRQVEMQLKDDQIKKMTYLEDSGSNDGITMLVQHCRLRMCAVVSVVRWFPGSQWVEAEAPRLAGAFLRHDLQVQHPLILILHRWFVWSYFVDRLFVTSICVFFFHDSLHDYWLCLYKSNSCAWLFQLWCGVHLEVVTGKHLQTAMNSSNPLDLWNMQPTSDCTQPNTCQVRATRVKASVVET